MIVVCDGGSIDNTCAIASEYPNVLLTHFDEKYYRKDGSWRNPEGRMISHVLSVAEDNGADWVVFDDCDCVPNSHLKRDIRGYMETTEFDYIFVPRIYVYGQDQYFDRLGKNPAGDWWPRIFAWRANLHLRTLEMLCHWEFPEPSLDKRVNLTSPYFRLHYFCPDEETTQRKLADCRTEVPQTLHPLEFGGELLSMPDEWR